MTFYIYCHLGYRPILDAVKSFSNDAGTVDIEVIHYHRISLLNLLLVKESYYLLSLHFD